MPDPWLVVIAMALLLWIGRLLGVHQERDRQERNQQFAARRRRP